jgi:hypothetical protein
MNGAAAVVPSARGARRVDPLSAAQPDSAKPTTNTAASTNTAALERGERMRLRPVMNI